MPQQAQRGMQTKMSLIICGKVFMNMDLWYASYLAVCFWNKSDFYLLLYQQQHYL